MSLTALLSMKNTFTTEDELKQVHINQVFVRQKKIRTAEFPYGENFLRRKILTAKTPYGEISVRQKIRTAKSPYGEKILRRKNLRPKILRRKLLTPADPTPLWFYNPTRKLKIN